MPEITVIGCRAGSPGECGPASGYVVRLAQATFLVDCGPGVVAGLAERNVIGELDAVIVSHVHADHCADLIALAYHRSFPRRLEPLPLYGPPSLAKVVEQLDRVFGIPSLAELTTPIGTALPFSPLKPGASHEILRERVDTLAMNHPVETFAFRFPDVGFTYTADGSLTDALVEFASGSQLLLAEATYLNGEGRDLVGHGHMTAETVGHLARRARVEQLVVTHFADCSERDATRSEAQRIFGAKVMAATPGLTIELG